MSQTFGHSPIILGHPNLIVIGVAYARGCGVRRNLAEAERLFAIASAQGDAGATQALKLIRPGVNQRRDSAQSPRGQSPSEGPAFEFSDHRESGSEPGHSPRRVTLVRF